MPVAATSGMALLCHLVSGNLINQEAQTTDEFQNLNIMIKLQWCLFGMMYIISVWTWSVGGLL